ncbi:hypothetical protein CC86DRAFT_373512 [Ophiobolus disseminans]|uniref:CUE domain-containing protein n=1 Tax=Ophiobolus disseminans TaxID=1469910 RepID=A0A6A6ZMU8_9PLEO|nr:hypothetical protein CC86DRAFT_373512 [Ophiobolus disseminans]
MAHQPSNDNPWQDEASPTGRNESGAQGHQNPSPYSAHYQDQAQPRDPYTQESHQGQYQPPNHPPPHQQPLSSHPPDQQQRYYASAQDPPLGSEPQHAPHQSEQHHGFAEPASNYQPQHNSSVPAQFHQYQGEEVPPSLPPRRTATDLALPTGQDRSHQIEVMQSYEAAGRKDEHDHNVELLQREFPTIDGSLIAAIYGDSQSLSATREMLGALES